MPKSEACTLLQRSNRGSPILECRGELYQHSLSQIFPWQVPLKLGVIKKATLGVIKKATCHDWSINKVHIVKLGRHKSKEEKYIYVKVLESREMNFLFYKKYLIFINNNK